MPVYQTEGTLHFESDDGGMAQIAEVMFPCDRGPDEGLFVRIHSWSELRPPLHPEVEALEGKRVRVTIEVLLCPTCGEPDTTPPTTRAEICSNSFHLGRDPRSNRITKKDVELLQKKSISI